MISTIEVHQKLNHLKADVCMGKDFVDRGEHNPWDREAWNAMADNLEAIDEYITETDRRYQALLDKFNDTVDKGRP